MKQHVREKVVGVVLQGGWGWVVEHDMWQSVPEWVGPSYTTTPAGPTMMTHMQSPLLR